jgi:hypothetical protein
VADPESLKEGAPERGAPIKNSKKSATDVFAIKELSNGANI